MFAIERSHSLIEHREIVRSDNDADCLLERSRTQSQRRQNVNSHSPQSSSGSSNRPAYKLFPTVEPSPPRFLEPRQKPSLDENTRPSALILESPQKTLAVRRGRRTSLSLLRSKTPFIQEPTKPVLVISAPLQSKELPPLFQSSHPGLTSNNDRPGGINGTLICNLPEKPKLKHSDGSQPAQSPSMRVTDPAPESPQRGHTRQSSSVSTTTSSIDYLGSPVELTAVSTIQRVYSPSGIDMRVREVMVAPPSDRVRRQQVESIKELDNEACKPRPLFASGSRVRSQPQTIEIPQTVDDREPGVRTPKSAPPIPTLQQHQPSERPSQPLMIDTIPREEQQKEESTAAVPPKIQHAPRQLVHPRTPTPPPSTRRRRSPVEQPIIQKETTKKPLPDLPTTIASPKRSNAPDPAKVLAAVARQSEALHARYSALRAHRLKLTKAIAVTLKEMQTQSEYASVLVNQQLSLNATMSSMDICFAKLKSLETQKDQAVALLDKQREQSGVPPMAEEIPVTVQQDRRVLPATQLPATRVPEQSRSEPKVLIDRGVFERNPLAPHPQYDHASAVMPVFPQQYFHKTDACKMADAYKMAAYDPKQIDLRREIDTYKEVVVERPQVECRALPPVQPPAQTSSSESSFQSSDSDAMMINRTRQMRVGGVRSAKNLNATATARQFPPTILPRSPGLFQLRDYDASEAQSIPSDANNNNYNKPSKSGHRRAKTPHSKVSMPIPYLPNHLQQRSLPPARPPPPPPPAAAAGVKTVGRRHVQEDSMASVSTSFSSMTTGGDSSPDEEEESEAKTPRNSSEGIVPMIPAKNPRRAVKPSTTTSSTVQVQVLSCEAHEFWEFCEGSFRLSRTTFTPHG